jgi:hypothetical protein
VAAWGECVVQSLVDSGALARKGRTVVDA